MAYGKIKTWIAAEVLTASDLNDEFSNSVTNENDLGTKLTAEITTRTTLESEYDTFYAASWNAGDSQIKNNVVALASMKDSSVGNAELVDLCVTHGKVAAANVDGAVSVPSMRTLGTGALQAMPGNANPETTLATTEHGSVMLPFFDLSSGTEYISVSNTYEDIVTGFRVYIPPGATVIRMASCQKNFHGGEAYQGYVRFYVGENASSESTCHDSAYTWKNASILNVAALEGWYTMKIQIHRTGTQSDHRTYLKGYSFVWE